MATIKKIQLRGISRTPSDRLTADGGCAESLNVYLDNDEIAPVVKPEDITEQIAPNLIGKPIYQHTSPSFKNVISIDGKSIYYNGSLLFTLGNYEELADVAHIGNTLVISTNESMHYFIYKNNAYTSLGGNIPFPTVEITASDIDTTGISKVVYSRAVNNSQPDQDLMFNPSKWNKYKEDGTNSYLVAKEVSDSLYTEFEESENQTHYSWPFVARYALRLRDGSIITSVPILVAPQNIRGFSSAVAEYSYGDGSESISVKAIMELFKPRIHLQDYNDEMKIWSDVVQGIDIYFSTQIEPDTKCIGVNLLESDYEYAKADILLGGEEYSEEEAILEKGVFFKVASYEFARESDVEKLYEGDTLAYIKPDDLMVLDQLDPFKDIMESGAFAPQNLSTFNSRLIASNIISRISSGPKCMTSTDGDITGETWYFRFYVESNGEMLHVLRRNIDDHDYFNNLNPYSWITYPDVHCVKVDVGTRSGKYVSIPMKEHPRLNCSYAYLGPKPLIDYMAYDEEMAGTVPERDDKDTYRINNKIFLSEVDNPIIFPIANRYTIGSGEIVGMAVATQALSQGQYGRFPLYVFTSDGIWTMQTNEEGKFTEPASLSKEICDNPKSIIPLEQEVIFNTNKGVMLLSGSDVTELSPFMNGKHYIVEPSAKMLAETQPGFKDLIGISADTTPFMAFIDGAISTYDYAGKRIILINPLESYQYVYKIDTQTWHKMCLREYVAVDKLNSYPECHVVATDDEGRHRILNYSTILDSGKEQTTELGIIATRPFDLDEPDVLKTIKDIRVRGQYPKGAVNFILLGSNDGHNYYTISTLHGKAWKQFRLVILSKLAQNDRISWVDIAYETRFTNRLR